MSQYSQFSVSKVFGMPSIPEKVTAIGYADGSNPFIPATDTNYVFRKEFLREVLAYLKEPGGDALFVTGPTGSGKPFVASPRSLVVSTGLFSKSLPTGGWS
ncbi:hypothetical protein QM088_26810 [Klebsiella pneumoniae]|nr:hypothetical protein [Klebsiella pneumoniae]MDV5545193.1 hypothetical protein [Klebsiella pneumoniae]